MADLEVERVSARYDTGQNVLRDVTFSLCSGQVMLIHGHNGSGKSTLLRVLSGLLPIQGGRILWRGEMPRTVLYGGPVHSWVGLMLQTSSVFPSLTVRDNVGLAVDRRKSGLRETVMDDIPILQPLWRKRAGLLSGGERKLLGLAMAMAARPPLLLLDEPIAGLSAANAGAVLQALARRKSEGAVIIVVEHSVEALRNVLVDVDAQMNEGVLAIERKDLERKEGP